MEYGSAFQKNKYVETMDKVSTISYEDIKRAVDENTAKFSSVQQSVATQAQQVDVKEKEVFKPFAQRKTTQDKMKKVRAKLIVTNVFLFSIGLLALFIYNMISINSLKGNISTLSAAQITINQSI